MSLFNDLYERYFNKTTLPSFIILCFDWFIAFFSFIFIITFQYGWGLSVEHPLRLLFTSVLYSAFYVIGFLCFRTYSGIIRYFSFQDLTRLILAGLTGCLISSSAHYFLKAHWWLFDIRLITILFSTILIVILMIIFRIAVRKVYVALFNRDGSTKAFFYGESNGSIDQARDLTMEDGNEKITVCGFFSDNPQMVGKSILGRMVYRNDKNLIPLLKKKKVGMVIVSTNEEESLRKNPEFVDDMVKAGIRVMLLPSVSEMGKNDSNHLKEIQIEDLLDRDPIEIDKENIGKSIEGHCVLITGAAGSIGSEIVRQLTQFNPSCLVLVDQAETPLHDMRLELIERWPNGNACTIVANITNEARMDKIFREARPYYVFHAAAYKHVPMMENNVSESVQNNIKGTMILARLAVKYEVKKFVMVSSDKAVNPTNVMGCSKRLCEIFVQSLDHDELLTGQGCTKFITTRFGNVLGSNGSVIPLFKKQIAAGGPLTVTHKDIVRFFMTIPEACSLVLEAGAFGDGGYIYEFDMGKPVKIADLAKRMILLSGAKNVEIEYVGLRDGEKLYEELLNKEETSEPTQNEKIRVAKVREYDYALVCNKFDNLLNVSYTFDEMAIVKAMKEIVPEFRSNNSRFNCLDRPQ